MRLIFSLFVLVLFIACNKRITTTTLNIPDYLVGDTANKNHYGIDFLFQLTNDSVYEYNGKAHNILTPKNWKKENILWGETYYTAPTHKSRNLYYLINKTENKYEIIADENGNFDFNDDRVQSTLNAVDSFTVTLSIKNSIVFKVYKRIADTALSKKVIASFTKSKMLPRHNSTWQYYLQETRCTKKIVSLPNNNQLTIEDYNCNGTFNDAGDKVYAFNILKDKPFSEKQTVSFKKGALVPYINETYILKNIDKYGTKIKLEKTETKIDFTNYLTNFALTTETEENTSYKDLPIPKTYTVLYFWGTWCKPCVEGTDSVNAFYNKIKDKVNFYGINSGDKLSTILKYKNYKKINFPVLLINDKNIEKIKVTFFPQFIIINNENIIIQRTASWQIAQQKLDSLLH
jgi:thiol-disulfide isomerase/thioredoxin